MRKYEKQSAREAEHTMERRRRERERGRERETVGVQNKEA